MEDIWRDDVVESGKTFSPELQMMFHDIHEISEFNQYDLARVSSPYQFVTNIRQVGRHIVVY